MPDRRMIIEIGMGNDQYGMDYTKAAARAIKDAIRHSALPVFATLELSTDVMRVNVTVGVQEPDKVDTAALAALLPRGHATVSAVKGGLNVANPAGNTIVIASAAVEAFLPVHDGWTLKT